MPTFAAEILFLHFRKTIMKKALLLVAACAALFACQQKGATTETAAADSLATDTLYYEGTVPAADGPGIRYQIALAQDSTLTVRISETYLEGNNGKDTTFLYEGKAEEVEAPTLGQGAKGLKLVVNAGETFNFWVKNDSTLTLVNADWKANSTEANWDLKRK